MKLKDYHLQTLSMFKAYAVDGQIVQADGDTTNSAKNTSNFLTLCALANISEEQIYGCISNLNLIPCSNEQTLLVSAAIKFKFGIRATFAELPLLKKILKLSIYLRGLELGNLSLPLLLVLDFLMFFKAPKSLEEHVINVLFANVNQPTFFSRLALKKLLASNWLKQLDELHSPANNGVLPMPALYWYAFHVNGFLGGKT